MDLVVSYLDRYGSRVAAGPFRGMALTARGVGFADVLVAKLAGSYECELRECLEDAIRRAPGLVVNVGAADGYYAVGLASRLPSSRVVAFEQASKWRYLCRANAVLNAVDDRVEVLGECDAERLRAVLMPGAIVLCDCEGAEREILRPDVVPVLLDCAVLVELHGFVDPAIPDEVVQRFARTHALTRVGTAPRDPADFPLLARFGEQQIVAALDEHRPGPMEWAYLVPLTQTGSAGRRDSVP
jgi:hypothetical protein